MKPPEMKELTREEWFAARSRRHTEQNVAKLYDGASHVVTDLEKAFREIDRGRVRPYGFVHRDLKV